MARKVRQFGNIDWRDISAAVGVDTGEDSIVQQQFKDEVDVNVIVRRFGGSLPEYEGGVYGDFTGISDFETARERIQRAQEDFMKLPAELREKYANDVGRFLEAAQAMSDSELDSLVPTAVVGQAPGEPDIADVKAADAAATPAAES